MKETSLIRIDETRTIIIDASDAAVANQHKWYCHNGYAATNRHRSVHPRYIRLHQLLLGAVKGQEIDHINGNKLDNRRGNLRFVTRQQNQYNRQKCGRNTSGYKGVSFSKKSNKYRAMIKAESRNKGLGYFDTAEEAAKVYDEAALMYFGEYAWLNFPIKKEGH